MQISQSSHHTFRVSFAREYILPATRTIDIIWSGHVKAWTSLVLVSSPPGGGGPVGAVGGRASAILKVRWPTQCKEDAVRSELMSRQLDHDEGAVGNRHEARGAGFIIAKCGEV